MNRWLLAMPLLLMQSIAAATTIELTGQQLQQTVEQYFPIQHTTSFARLGIYRPVVVMDRVSSRIGLSVSVTADVPGMMQGTGRGTIDSDLVYNRTQGEFHLRDPKIRLLELVGFPAEISASIQRGLQEMMQQSLPVILVYKLNNDDFKQRLTKSILSSVKVENGKLILELSNP